MNRGTCAPWCNAAENTSGGPGGDVRGGDVPGGGVPGGPSGNARGRAAREVVRRPGAWQRLGRHLVAALLPLGLVMLAGCDYFAEKKLVPGIHAEADVRNFMGKPELVSEEPDGSRRLEYPRSPMGAETYFVYIGPDGKYKAMEKAMNEANFAKVKSGMSRDDVRRILGKQTETTPLALKNEEVWSWRYEVDNSKLMFFNAHFDKASGKVVRISRDQDWRGMGG